MRSTTSWWCHPLRALRRVREGRRWDTAELLADRAEHDIGGHGDYHPAFGRSFSDTVDLAMDSPSSMLSGEAFLERVLNVYRSATSETGANVWNIPLLIGWDEPGGTYDHVPSGPVPTPDPSAPPGELGFTFDCSGYHEEQHRSSD